MSKNLFLITIFAIFLTQLSPLITETPKFFCSRTESGEINCLGLEFNETSFFYVRLAIILAAVVLYALIQYYQTYKPQRKYREVRTDIFHVLLAPSIDSYVKEGFSLRINVMKAIRPIRYLGFCQKLQPVFHYGFEPKHRDSQLSFLVSKLFRYAQGNSGQAFLAEKPQLADLTDGVPYDYNLSKDEINKTLYIKGIISIPVFETFSEDHTSKAIGVINIDTNDADLVQEWVQDEECLQSVIEAFEHHAKIVSHLI